MREYAAYVFDLDGTLITLPADWKAVRTEAHTLGFSVPADEPFFEWLEHQVTSSTDARQSLLPMIDRHELAAAPRSALQPGAVSLLTRLSSRAKLALVTMQGRAVCSELTRLHHISGFFQAVLTREDSLSRESQIKGALGAMQVLPSEALVIGDRGNDALSARRVGADAALLGNRRTDGPGPTYCFPTLGDLAAAMG